MNRIAAVLGKPEEGRGKGKEAVKNNDKGMAELLELLKNHPELISGLLFDPANIKRLLKSKAARRLVLGADAKAFLRYVAGSKDGGPIALCAGHTAAFCAATILCLGGTKSNRRCRFTKPTRVG